MSTATLVVRVQLSLGWITYLLFSPNSVNFVWKTDEGKAESIVFCFFFFGSVLIVGGWRVVGWVRKSYLGPAEIASFSSRDFSRSYKHDTFWRVLSTGYFYVLFSWAIAVSNFCPLEIKKNLGIPLSIVNSHAYNRFYKYIYLFRILYSMK